MIHEFNHRVKSATNCCCRKEHSKTFHGAVDKFFKNDRELKKALKSVEKHLDIEAMIKMSQRVRALERLVLSKDDDRFKQQDRILSLNRYNYLTSGEEDTHFKDHNLNVL
jgi:macrodomain Ter protein organizer (MatP/YcbG family)